MKTKIFKVQGKFLMGRGLKHFTKELKAVSEDDVREKIYSLSLEANTGSVEARYS